MERLSFHNYFTPNLIYGYLGGKVININCIHKP